MASVTLRLNCVVEERRTRVVNNGTLSNRSLTATLIGMDSSGPLRLRGRMLRITRRNAEFLLTEKVNSGQKLTITFEGNEPELFELVENEEHVSHSNKTFKVRGVVTSMKQSEDIEDSYIAVIRFDGHFTIVAGR